MKKVLTMYYSVSQTDIARVKRTAKKEAKDLGLTHLEYLNAFAKEQGYEDFQKLVHFNSLDEDHQLDAILSSIPQIDLPRSMNMDIKTETGEIKKDIEFEFFSWDGSIPFGSSIRELNKMLAKMESSYQGLQQLTPQIWGLIFQDSNGQLQRLILIIHDEEQGFSQLHYMGISESSIMGAFEKGYFTAAKRFLMLDDPSHFDFCKQPCSCEELVLVEPAENFYEESFRCRVCGGKAPYNQAMKLVANP